MFCKRCVVINGERLCQSRERRGAVALRTTIQYRLRPGPFELRLTEPLSRRNPEVLVPFTVLDSLLGNQTPLKCDKLLVDLAHAFDCLVQLLRERSVLELTSALRSLLLQPYWEPSNTRLHYLAVMCCKWRAFFAMGFELLVARLADSLPQFTPSLSDLAVDETASDDLPDDTFEISLSLLLFFIQSRAGLLEMVQFLSQRREVHIERCGCSDRLDTGNL